MSELTDAIFGEGGILSRKIEGYRSRPGQIEMAEAVEAGLDANEHVVAEAPTGTGKSFAAGLPAAINSVTEGRTIVYVTANIALQEQLYYKDLPMIAEIIDELVDEEERCSWCYATTKDGPIHGETSCACGACPCNDCIDKRKETIEPAIKYALIKGMSNYLCKANFNDALEKNKLGRQWRNVLTKWSNKTDTGDKGELENEPPQATKE